MQAKQPAPRRRSAGLLKRLGETVATFSGAAHRPGSSWTVNASLPLDTGAPRTARNLAGYLGSGRLAPSVVEDVQLVVSELVTNSVRHSGAAADARIGLWIRLAGATVRVEVTDPGRNGTVVPRAPDQEAGGGYGLVFVRTLAERWGLEQSAVDGTRVWAHLSGAAQPSRSAA